MLWSDAWRLLLLPLLLAGGASAGVLAKHSRHHRDSTPATPATLTATPPPPPVPATAAPAPDDAGYAIAVFDDLVTEDSPCSLLSCGAGRECLLDGAGRASCECRRRCPARARLAVCGSDGRRYASHCDLHRQACLQRRHIAFDHKLACLRQPTPAAAADAEAAADVDAYAAGNWTEQEKTTPAVDASQELSASQESGSDLDFLNNSVPDDPGPRVCTLQQYEIMKDNLLLYNHARLMAEDNRSSGKEYLVSIMFSHYDQNNDGALEKEELDEITTKEQLRQLSKGCTLGHMVDFDDADKDGHLDINEFYMAFSKLYSVSVVSLDKALQVNRLSARVGDNVEIKCDVSGTPPPPIVWRRHGADLAALAGDGVGVRVFSDGSLYLTRVQLVHAGNYSCHAQRNKDVVQTHVLTVHTIPEVKVMPKIQYRRPGEQASMFCHVVGEPFPKVEWLKNDEPLRARQWPRKYDLVGNGTELRTRHIAYADTGAYMCQARSVGGLTRDISSLVVQDEPTPTAPNEERRFFSFHDWGVSVYEPTACRLYHQIQATDIIPGTQQYVCGDKGANCSWGQAINVANRYVYVAQPRNDRVLVISKIQMVVVDVVVTDKFPVELHYVPHLDQVWVLNWRAEHDSGVKTIQVIRDASQKRKHHTVHPEPIDGQFDLVQGLFVPPLQDLRYKFQYGYVSHWKQRGLYKIDLANMRYVRSVDLSLYNCVPRHLQFSSLYGLVIVECEQPAGQLLLDYLTDAVVSHRAQVSGRPYVSPDSRAVVTLDRGRDGVTLVVQRVQDDGLKFLFDVKTTLNVSDIAFYPSRTNHGYDLYASGTDKEDILFLNLVTGKVEMITGVGRAMPARLSQWGAPNRPIAASGVFGHYMVTSASGALFVINGETRTVNCEIGGLARPRALVWVTMRLQ
ncbi:follistatin-related protein 5-like isoform X2 [Schistocerca gregaria]|uniref:follistatin-related protein 5-like isoform X2 n=1 Tax=Schistocerca gregaria TaxID=7010 RepID=UPI00211E9A90|nr:follistatin-related protein 5-like isoform X2 [Schistocerca gregaria]